MLENIIIAGTTISILYNKLPQKTIDTIESGTTQLTQTFCEGTNDCMKMAFQAAISFCTPEIENDTINPQSTLFGNFVDFFFE